MPKLYFQYGSNGYFTFKIHSKEDAIKILVLLRDTQSGFYYNINNPDDVYIKGTTTNYMDKIVKILKKQGYHS